MVRALMRTRATTDAPADTDADTIAIGVIEGEPIAHDVEDGALQALVDAGEAKPKLRKVAVAHAAGKRWLLVGLGQRDGLDAEAARVAAATAQARASELGTRVLAWEVPHHVGADVAGALVEGTVLGAYRFERFKSERDEREQRIEELVVSSHEDVGAPVATATVVAEAANAARDLENMPANELTPTALGEHALALAAGIDGLECEVEHRAEIEGCDTRERPPAARSWGSSARP
jgi:leucyl aminopeptidase